MPIAHRHSSLLYRLALVGALALPALEGRCLTDLGVPDNSFSSAGHERTNDLGPERAKSTYEAFSANTSVRETAAPIISGCPTSPIVVDAPANACSSTVTWAAPTAMDNNAVAVVIQTQGLPPGSEFPVGLTTISYETINVSGSPATCTFQVEVRDVTIPVISCPDDIAVDATAGLCGAIVTFQSVQATDNCGVASITLTNGPPSGSLFPVGSTMITHRVTTNSGQTRNCSFWITVFDSQAPTLTGCVDRNVQTNSANCSRTVSYATPTATDNCTACPTTASLIGFLPLGTYEGRSYFLQQNGATWGAANAAAVAAGGHLTVIRDEAMNTWLRDAVTAAGTTGAFWIGLNDAGSEGSWRWTNNNAVAYTNWDIGEPNSTGGEGMRIMWNSSPMASGTTNADQHPSHLCWR